MDKEFFEKYKQDFPNGPIQYVNMAGIVPEVIEERHIRLRLVVDPIHMNHVGTVYAGSMFTFGEVAGGHIFNCTYGRGTYVPIIKGSEIKYLKPTKHDLIIDIALTEEEAEEKIALAKERGRGDYFLDIEIKDTEGVLVAVMKSNYYALSAEAAKSFGK